MPRSFSISFESITRSSASPRVSPNVPDCCNNLSTKVVLPWSTCAIIAMLRNFEISNFCIEILNILSLKKRVDFVP